MFLKFYIKWHILVIVQQRHSVTKVDAVYVNRLYKNVGEKIYWSKPECIEC